LFGAVASLAKGYEAVKNSNVQNDSPSAAAKAKK